MAPASDAATPVEIRIFLVRHAQPSLPDASQRFVGGSSDPALGPIGVSQAERLAERLAGVDFSRVWSSGLTRSAQTAAIISGLPPEKVCAERDLREIDVGLWEGLTADEVKERYPKEWAQRESAVLSFRFPGGESFQEMRGRSIPAFFALAREAMAAAARNTLIVAHKNVNRALLCEFLGLPLGDMFTIPQDYCSMSVLRLRAERNELAVTVEERFD